MAKRRSLSAAEFRAQQASRPWSNAKPTHCLQGHRHASRLEARVCERLTLEAREQGLVLYQQVRLPLWSLAPDDRGRALVITVDSALVQGARLVRLVDAKGRRSRDWLRGAKAAEASYGLPVEEVTR